MQIRWIANRIYILLMVFLIIFVTQMSKWSTMASAELRCRCLVKCKWRYYMEEVWKLFTWTRWLSHPRDKTLRTDDSSLGVRSPYMRNQVYVFIMTELLCCLPKPVATRVVVGTGILLFLNTCFDETEPDTIEINCPNSKYSFNFDHSVVLVPAIPPIVTSQVRWIIWAKCKLEQNLGVPGRDSKSTECTIL